MVKAFFLAAIGGLVPFAFAVPSQLYEDYNLRFRRAIGDQCQAPDGTGTCQSTSECAGISYPTNLCPNDPKDVQCCVTILCNVPNIGTGFCRSVHNNGCGGGKFHKNACPGSSDIRCCVTPGPQIPPPPAPPSEDAAPPPPPPAVPSTPTPNPCTPAAVDKLLFEDDIGTFNAAKSARTPSCFDWTDDGCSCSPDDVGEFNFLPPCQRHDFGYRNTKAQGRFDPAMKDRIDSIFEKDLYDVCGKFTGLESFKEIECRRIADIYVFFVRQYSGMKKKREMEMGVGVGVGVGLGVMKLHKRECDLLDAIKGLFE